MKTITQLIIQFTTDDPKQAGVVIDRITDTLTAADCHQVISNPLIKVEQTIHPEA